MSADTRGYPVGTQPKATAPMSTDGGNKNALNRPIGPDGKRDWSYGLCSCFSACGLCCWAVCCPCVVYSKNRQRLRSLQHQGAPLPGGGERYDDYCFIYGCLTVVTGYGWVLHINQATDVRERYGIRGSPICDCFKAWCCRPCSLTQERREIELEENSLLPSVMNQRALEGPFPIRGNPGSMVPPCSHGKKGPQLLPSKLR
ncbi:PLAC8 family-domain-containing protein [Russula earlei]|uniref:PLAC8 family-domain-containing protein n=1 Tax=Russula earlei TaxID=71964 RepID=A0ACC0U3L2_9AGAM|nr:PLAC8 family-domain-containing protein [Russula earlei]